MPSHTGMSSGSRKLSDRPLVRDRQRWGRLEHRSIGPQEGRRPVSELPHRESALVNGPVMASAQEDEVVEAGRAAVDPVLDVMRVAAAGRAAGESATPVARLKRPPDRGRHRAGLAPDVEDGAVGAMTHRHHRGVAGKASRRFRGNVHRSRGPPPRSPTDLPLPPHRSGPPRAARPGSGRRRDPRSRSDVSAASASSPRASARRWAGVTSSASRSAFGSSCASRNSRSAAASSARWTTAPTSGVRRPRITTIPSSSTQVERCRCRCRDSSCAAAATSSTRRQARTRRSTLGRRAGLREVQQRRFVVGRGHAGQRPHLGVRDGSALHRGADARQRRQRVGDAHLLPGRAQVDAGAPVQPMRTGGSRCSTRYAASNSRSSTSSS